MRLPGVSKVGGSFTGTTVRTKSSLDATALVSVTVTVMVTLPLWLVDGRSVINRLVPVPVMTMFVGESRFVFEVLTRIFSASGRDSMSSTTKGIASVESSNMDWSAMLDKVGGS